MNQYYTKEMLIEISFLTILFPVTIPIYAIYHHMLFLQRKKAQRKT